MRNYSTKIALALFLILLFLSISLGAPLAQDGTVKWQYSLPTNDLSERSDTANPAIGLDGSIYVVGKHSLYAVNPSGTLKWNCLLVADTDIFLSSSPSVGPDGSIYVGSSEGHLYSVKPDGTLLWDLNLPNAHEIRGSPAIGKDGTIYVAHGGNWRNNDFYAINPDGTIKWQGGHWVGMDCSPAIGPDGTVYFLDRVAYFFGIDPDGQKFELDVGDGSGPIAIGEDGTVYVGCLSGFCALTANGKKKWEAYGSVPPAIGPDGVIYTFNSACYASCDSPPCTCLSTIDPVDGTNKCSTPISETGFSPAKIQPTIGLDGTIYSIGTEKNEHGLDDVVLLALNLDGSLKWRTNIRGYSSFTVGAPVIGSDGSIYVSTGNWWNYDWINHTGNGSIISIRSSSMGLAESPWPMFQHDAHHTGRASQGPATLPKAPKKVTATAGIAQAVVSFTAPTWDGGSPIISYEVSSSPGGISATGTESPITVKNLSIGTDYTFTVTATNAVGTGPASSPSNSVTPANVPTAPRGVKATAGKALAIVSFNAPASNGGSPILSYEVTSSPGGITATGTESPITVKNLSIGTAYTFTVQAANAFGTGPASKPSNSVIPDTGYGWYPKAKMPAGAYSAGSAVAGGKLYIIGSSYPSSYPLDKISIYNPQTNRWSGVTVNYMGSQLRAAGISNNIYIFDTSWVPTKPSWIYNLKTKTISPMAGTPSSLQDTSEPAVYNGKIYFFGGYVQGSGPLKTTWEFDPATLIYTKKADMPTAGYGAATATLNGNIYVIGGISRGNTIEIYDPKTNKWAPKLSYHDLALTLGITAAPLGDKIAIVQGYGSTYLFDPATKILALQDSMPRIHGYSLCGESLGGRLYVVGGANGPNLLDSFSLNPATSTIATWLPLSEEDALAASEPDYLAIEAEHLLRLEQAQQEAAAGLGRQPK